VTILSANLGDKMVHDAAGIITDGDEVEYVKVYLPEDEDENEGGNSSGSRNQKDHRGEENVKIATVIY
jgi:hypothetical protein